MADGATAPALDSADFEQFKAAVAAHNAGETPPAKNEDETPGENSAENQDDETGQNTGENDDNSGGNAGENQDETPEQKAAKEAAAKNLSKKSVSERIAEFRRGLTEAQEVAAIEAAESERQRIRAEKAEKELQELRAGKTPSAAGDKKVGYQGAPLLRADGRPNPDAYEFGLLDPAYDDAKEEWRMEQLRAEINKTKTVDAEQAAAAARQTQFETTVAKGLEKHDDYLQVVVETADKGTWRLTPIMAQTILDAGPDAGSEIAYHLAKNPAEAAAIAEMPPHRQAAAIGRLEAKLAPAPSDDGDKGGANTQQQQKVKATAAPEPPNRQPKGSSGEFQARPDTKDLNAYRRLVERKQQGK